MDGRCLPAYFTRIQQHKRKRGADFNQAARNQNRKTFRKQNKTNRRKTDRKSEDERIAKKTDETTSSLPKPTTGGKE
jgi:hypothetical protein